MLKQLVRTSRHGPVLEIRLCSPENRNSLTTELREQLGEAIEHAERERAVRSVFLTAEGPTFCSGGDMKLLRTASDPWSVHRRFRSMSHWLTPLITLDKPVVIGMRGAAVGGGLGLALTGDVLIAGESAQFISGFFRLGVVPDVGTMYHLPRLIGMAQAKRFLFRNATMSATEALALGLVAEVVRDDEVEAVGLVQAAQLAEGPAEVIGLAKSLMARSFESSLTEMLAFEGLGQALAMANPEFHEGVNAFLERRAADFVGVATPSSDRSPSDDQPRPANGAATVPPHA